MSFLQLHPNLRVRIGVSFVQHVLQAMIMPFMAIYLATRFGPAAAGIMMLVGVSLGVLGNLLGGYLSDIRGRRVTLLIGELVVFATFALMAIANSSWWDSALAAYFCYVINNFAASMAFPANDAMIIDVTTPEIRKFAYTVNYWSINLALATGALVGGFLYGEYFTNLLMAAAACTLGVFATTYFFITETTPDTGAGPTRTSPIQSFVAGYGLVVRDRTFARLLLAATLGMAIEFQLINYIAVRLSQGPPSQTLFAIGSWEVSVTGVEMLGILRAENTLLVVALALFTHRLLGRMNNGLRLYLGITLFTTGYMMLAVSEIGWVLLLAALVLTVGELMNVPVKQTLLAALVREDSRSRYLAVYNLNLQVAMVIAALCITLGTLIPPWGMALLYALFGSIIILQYRAILARLTAAKVTV